MINELTVLTKLVEVITEDLGDYLDEQLADIVEGQVLLEFPNVDKMPYPVMFYVQPDYAEFEDGTTCSDKETFNCSIFILCKRDTEKNLTIKTYGYYNALYNLLRKETSLQSTVGFTGINDVTFYPAIEGNPSVQGAEVSISTVFEQDFN